MEQETGSSYISLNENEQRYYSGLHSLCQTDAGSGKLSAVKVAELLKASQLPPESLHQVTGVCGARRSGFFGSAQFLVALKLVAAAQTGLPISLESTPKDLPLPRFPGLQSDQDPRYAVGPQGLGAQQDPRYAVGPQGLGAQQDPRYAEIWSPTPSPLSSPPHSPPLLRHYPVTMATPGAIPHTGEHTHTHTHPHTHTHTHTCTHTHTHTHTYTHASVEQQRVCSDEGDPWRITVEQQEYYTTQFKSLQSDLGALILGTVAKNFFTKSKLPIPELSHIWELSDVDRDGALTFSEFCTAFHLIVARKNGCSLPETLPHLPDSPSLPNSLCRSQHSTPSRHRQTRPSLQTANPLPPHPHPPYPTPPPLSLLLPPFFPPPLTPLQPFPPLLSPPFPPPQPSDRSYSSTSIDEAMKKAEEPPTPPPRPQKTHSRASSLDLNKLLQQGAPGVRGGWLPPPPALPPRPLASQEENQEVHRDGPLAEDLSTAPTQVCVCVVPQKPVRRKLHPDNPEAPPPSTAALAPPTKPLQRLQSKQKRGIQTIIRENKESNAVLTRLNSELQQQLKEVHQQRIMLESQLDLLRPLNSRPN
ncbi:unnamed protein product [Lota lota]